MSSLQAKDDDYEEPDCEIDSETNLLDLGPDAWDDSALIDAFNKDLKLYQKSHANQLIDLSKVSNMINFKKATKINQSVKKQQHEESESDDDNDDDSDSDNNKSDNVQIMAPSFMPFANKNTSESTKMNKYSSWPPTQKETDNKRKNRKKRKGKKKKKQKSDAVYVESENLAKMYEAQQQRERAKQTQAHSTNYDASNYGNATQYEHTYGRYPQQPYYNETQPQQPPMPPYARSAMFNMGLNMMGPPSMMTAKPTRDEALANMLLAWYWNGYYAGYQAAREHNHK